jgi:hypothetical protein
MPANVRSIPAIADFRATLTTFGDTASRALDEVNMELGRAIRWISDEQPAFWKSEVQRALDLVADRRNDLEQCEKRAYDGQRPTCYQERKALEAAKRYVGYCEEKVDVVRRWARTVQKDVSEYHSDAAKFRSLLDGELPKSLALLDRMVSALEGYTAIPVVTATPMAQQVSESIARTTPDEPETPAISVFHQLREHTPDLETRKGIQMRPAANSADMPDEGPSKQAAVKTAYDLQIEPQFPDWNDKIVLLAGALDLEQIYVERIASDQGDTGWFIGAVEPTLGATPEYQAIAMSELLRVRPSVLRALALPPGFLAVFSHDELVAIVDPDGRDLWPLAGAEVQTIKDKEQETKD